MPARTILHVLPHTHWDREWYEPFEGYRFRLLGVVDDLVKVLEADSRFHFHFDGQTAAIEDYLLLRPGAESGVAALVRDRKLAVGPWRILMDEFLCSPETIVRNLRQGMATAGRLGARPTIGYIPDSFGHIAQMPQILSLAGMAEAVVWRGVPFAVDRPVFWWEAPDGTRLRTMYLATSYSNAATLPQSFEELMVRAKRIVEDMAAFRPEGAVLAMCGSDHLGPQAHLPDLFAEANAAQDEIEFRIGPLGEYVSLLPSDGLPSWHGEMRSSARANLLMGVLSARMPLKQAEFAASSALERHAEPLAALSGFDPGTMLDEAWRGMVENSAHDSVCGCGIDAVAAAVAGRYERAHRIASLVAGGGLERLASQVSRPAGGVVVFNPSPFPRSGPVEATVMLPAAAPLARFVAPGGTPLRVQALEETEQVVVDMTIPGAQLAKIVPTIHSRQMGTLFVNRMELLPGRIRTVRLDLGPVAAGRFDVEAAKRTVEQAALTAPRARFRVIGTGPPLARVLIESPPAGGLGWLALTAVTSNDEAESLVSCNERAVDNGIVRVEVGDDGRTTLIHHATGLRIEGIGLRDGGDAGDEYTYSPPARDVIVDAPASTATLVVNEGPLEATIEVTQAWRVPQSLDASRRGRTRRSVTMPVTIRWAVRAGEPFARCTVLVDNTASDHRLRLHVPLPFTVDGSDADAAFGVTRRGLEAEGGVHEAPTPTFPSRRWVDASDGRYGIAVLHRGTPEYQIAGDGRDIAVTLLRCVGWLSRQDCSTRSGPAGPMLPAPGAQLPGLHRFELALYPHAGDWQTAEVARAAETFCYPMLAASAPAGEGELPSSGSALSIEPGSVQLSALERRDGAIDVRVYNACDDAVDAQIRVGAPLRAGSAALVDLTGASLTALREVDGTLRLPLRGWQIATIRLI